MEQISCCKCGVLFALTNEVYRHRLNDGKMFSCPNGHEQHFTESNVEKIKRLTATLIDKENKIEVLRKMIARSDGEIEAYRYSIRTLKGVNTKYRKRLYPEEYQLN